MNFASFSLSLDARVEKMLCITNVIHIVKLLDFYHFTQTAPPFVARERDAMN
jgi:hypothetical protein